MVSQDKYLSLFDAKTYGQLHHQEWAAINIKRFHESMIFSAQNSMVPTQVPKELQGLTQIEEMLIARAFPFISVYTKPGGQRAYKDHCINFHQDIQELADTLPRYPKELPIIVIAAEGKNNTSTDLYS